MDGQPQEGTTPVKRTRCMFRVICKHFTVLLSLRVVDAELKTKSIRGMVTVRIKRIPLARPLI
jgi:hypothetical protein